MPYVTKYKDVQAESITGYDPIPVHRPKFIYFEFNGLRPNIPHWIFFGGVDVTNWVNTSYNENSYNTDSYIKEPGERHAHETQFPTDTSMAYVGPTNSGSGPVYSDQYGVLSGVFYLQSNNDYSWPITSDGHTLLAIDISVPKKANCKSYGAATFRGFGQYENYYTYTTQQSYQEWVEPPKETPTTNQPGAATGSNPATNKHDDGGKDPEIGVYQAYDVFGNGPYNYVGDISFGSHGWHMINNSDTGKALNDADGNIATNLSDAKADDSFNDAKNSDCVIATHAVASGNFQRRDKANAVDWCKRNLHDKWWGEAMRRGYRYLGRKHIENGTADQVYKEFKECLEWGNGKRPFDIRIVSRYYYRVIQTFIVGLFVREN